MSFSYWEKTGDHGAPAFGGLDVDRAAVLLQDSVAQGQPEPEAPLLGGEERIEDLGPDRGGYTRPLVYHLRFDHHPLAPAHVDLAIEGVEADPRGQREPAAPLHGVHRVH